MLIIIIRLIIIINNIIRLIIIIILIIKTLMVMKVGEEGSGYRGCCIPNPLHVFPQC